jgi:acetylglutamate kinase
MVLDGKDNKEIVGQINHHGGKAVGLSGRDGDLIRARKMTVQKSQADNAPPELIDLGRVGEVTRVNPDILNTIDVQDFIPVIAPVGVGDDNYSYNINADLVAGAVAGQLQAAKLILLTDVEGVLDKDNRLVPSLSSAEADKLMATGTVAGGMIPKIKCCQDALAKGVTKTHIIDGRIEHAILLEMFTHEGIGTEIVQ